MGTIPKEIGGVFWTKFELFLSKTPNKEASPATAFSFLKRNGNGSRRAKIPFPTREKLELNSIATALTGQDYKKMGTDLEEALKNEKEALGAITKNKIFAINNATLLQ